MNCEDDENFEYNDELNFLIDRFDLKEKKPNYILPKEEIFAKASTQLLVLSKLGMHRMNFQAQKGRKRKEINSICVRIDYGVPIADGDALREHRE